MSMVAIVMVVGLLLLLAIGMPIAFTLGILALTGLFLTDTNPLILGQRLVAGTNVNSLLAIPGFILAGDLMSSGGLSRRLVKIASTIIGHLSGGLSMATVGAGTFFGAISGSAPATTAAIGSVMTDELEKRGYERGYAAALATAVGPLGQMIPPSIPMIIWGVLSEESIARLFLAGVVPGLIAASGFLVVSYIYARVHGVPRVERATVGDIALALRQGVWALLAPIVILGGIYGGVFTPTEAAMVGALYSFIVGVFIYREIGWRELPGILLRSLRTSAMIMFIIATAYAFAWVIANEQIPAQLAASMLAITDNPLLLLLLLNIMLLLLGAVMDNISAMVILSSVLMAVGAQIGLDPIQLGAMVVINFAVGMVTPPLGYSIFVGASISGLRIETVARHLWPFLLVLLAVIAIVAYVPWVTLWLPGLWD
ncbi:TRAP transporter large permease [Aquisalimonas sp. 2447]|uniref:TRAP transporter large permease n=1 Tax=Aquisalimonas sp. 2447 TaxID=2740807 RepID=UPI001432712B|nr:TRAP transporter large permease [Aquisalimonas sp. 2447]QIT54484.1 TRAP transporter large permease [Aquisalimonas sp. 2447]